MQVIAGTGVRPVEIDCFASDQLNALLSLEKARSREAHSRFNHSSVEDGLKTILSLRERGAIGLVACRDRQPVGYIYELPSIDPMTGGECARLEGFVRPEFRREGVATRLLQRSLTFDSQRVRKVFVRSGSSSDKFARSRGFSSTSPLWTLLRRTYDRPYIRTLQSRTTNRLDSPVKFKLDGLWTHIRPVKTVDEARRVVEMYYEYIHWPSLGIRPSSMELFNLAKKITLSSVHCGRAYVVSQSDNIIAAALVYLERSPLAKNGADFLWIRCPVIAEPNRGHGILERLSDGVIVHATTGTDHNQPLCVLTQLPPREQQSVEAAYRAFFSLGLRQDCWHSLLELYPNNFHDANPPIKQRPKLNLPSGSSVRAVLK